MTESTFLRPLAEPQILEGACTNDQYRRMLGVLREHGPWSLLLAQEFTSPEQVIATTSGSIPEGFQVT